MNKNVDKNDAMKFPFFLHFLASENAIFWKKILFPEKTTKGTSFLLVFTNSKKSKYWPIVENLGLLKSRVGSKY